MRAAETGQDGAAKGAPECDRANEYPLLRAEALRGELEPIFGAGEETELLAQGTEFIAVFVVYGSS